MKSHEYRKLIKTIVRNGVKKRFPGLKNKELEEAAYNIAVAIHARFYGANVDGVGSPIWRDHSSVAECDAGQPTISAQDMLDETPT
jgi:hypothetical protein